MGELYPGAERCTHFIIWRGGDIIHQITPGPGTSDYRTYSLSAKAYTTPLCRKHKTQYILISGDKLWEVTLPQ